MLLCSRKSRKSRTSSGVHSLRPVHCIATVPTSSGVQTLALQPYFLRSPFTSIHSGVRFATDDHRAVPARRHRPAEHSHPAGERGRPAGGGSVSTDLTRGAGGWGARPVNAAGGRPAGFADRRARHGPPEPRVKSVHTGLRRKYGRKAIDWPECLYSEGSTAGKQYKWPARVNGLRRKYNCKAMRLGSAP